MRTRIFNKMTAREVEAYLARGGDTIYLATGVLEVHGDMPIDCETIIPEAFAVKLAEKTDGLAMINLPIFYPGGTVISNATVHISIAQSMEYLHIVCKSLVDQGFRRIYLLTSHAPSMLTVPAFCRDFFEQTLVHPCHIGVAMMMGEYAKKNPAAGNPFALLDKVCFGAYELMGQKQFLPLDPDAEQPVIERKPQEPALRNLSDLLNPLGGRVSIIFSDPNEHGGGRIFKSEAERDAACAEGAQLICDIVDSLEVEALNESLAAYQAYVHDLAEKFPRLNLL